MVALHAAMIDGHLSSLTTTGSTRCEEALPYAGDALEDAEIAQFNRARDGMAEFVNQGLGGALLRRGVGGCSPCVIARPCNALKAPLRSLLCCTKSDVENGDYVARPEVSCIGPRARLWQNEGAIWQGATSCWKWQLQSAHCWS